MKMKPGIVRRPEKRKNHRRRPMMSNTTAGLSPDRPAADRAGEEFLLGYAVVPRLARPVLAHHEPQDRARDGDGREHRDEHADDQDERAAADRGRAEPVHDPGRDEAGPVR